MAARNTQRLTPTPKPQPKTRPASSGLVLREPIADGIFEPWKRILERGRQRQALCVRCPERPPYTAKEKLAKWLQEIPVEFPSEMDTSQGLPAFFNPLIGSDYKETCRKVSNLLEMFRNLALPPQEFPAEVKLRHFSLSEDGARGFIAVLECMTDALRFERSYRNLADYERPLPERE